ncbi:MAG: hypothetical protein DRI90_08405 [Deltaproteobacteria bacterium]|nr:MAG: hypothetical protein DRI90_08405 [Deltaproteobacteria bacterium]
MLTTPQRRLLAVVPLALTTMASTARGETYYVDFTGGDDAHTFVEAQNQATPWKTWEAFQGANGAAFQSGDRILFKRGETWKRSDYGDFFRPSAMDGVTFGAYGTGDRPTIDSDNDTAHTHGIRVGAHGRGLVRRRGSRLLWRRLERSPGLSDHQRGDEPRHGGHPDGGRPIRSERGRTR